jgi:hypothetical protein
MGWRMPQNAIYVGRPTRWGNPFKIGDFYQITLPYDDPSECQGVMEKHQAEEPRVTFYRKHPSWTFYRFDIVDNYSAALAY